MNQVRDHFLADAALASDQHVRFGWRHGVNQLLDFLHRLALEHRRESRFCELEALLQLFGFLSQRLRFPKKGLFFQRFFHQAQEFLRRVRFADKVIRAALDRFDGVGERVVRGQDDHLRFRPLGLDFIEHLQPFRVRQLQIEENKCRRFVF